MALATVRWCRGLGGRDTTTRLLDAPALLEIDSPTGVPTAAATAPSEAPALILPRSDSSSSEVTRRENRAGLDRLVNVRGFGAPSQE